MLGGKTIAAVLLGSLALSGCTLIPKTVPPPGYPVAKPAPAPIPSNARLLGVVAGPEPGTLGLGDARPGAALRSFIESCPRLTTRSDNSGLTKPSDWAEACAAAPAWSASDAAGFFVRYFETARVGEGSTFVTGYYEPEIAGTRTEQPGFAVPVYALPPDLVRGWPEDMPPEQRTGNPPLGRVDENGKFVPYYDRAAIEDGALKGKGLEIGYAADSIEFFFLQIQGSGRLLAPDGTVMRIGYAGQNGREYVGIGSLMRQRGLVGPGTNYPTSMQGLMAWLRDNPVNGKAIMRENPSYVFFREIKGDGPIGSLGVPVRGQASLAADPAFTPLGAPVFLQADRTEVSGLWVAQDTGGAIKGANRYDSFWGAGPTARSIAGGMTARGQALVFLPKGTLARLAGK